MNYYYLDGIEKRGPYSIEELKSRNLNPNTLVLLEGSKDWVKLSELEFNKIQKSKKNISIKKHIISNSKRLKANKKKVIISIITFLLLIFCYLIYDFFSLTESKAKEISNRFFNMLVINSLDDNIFNEIYPKYYSIGNRLVFKKECKIKNISKNSDGDFEVFATYKPNRVQTFPIYLLIGRENFKTIIKSSKGINYAYYDRVLEYGKKKGCLTGQEDDVEMGRIINDKNLRNFLEMKSEDMMNSLYRNLKVNNDIRSNWGYISGNVTITNNNSIDFGYFDFECKIEFYNKNGQITSSEEIYGINEINAFGSSSGRVFSTSRNSIKFKIVPIIKQTFELKNKIRDEIISNTSYGCY